MITERPWVTGGLISAATTVVIFGLIVVTQPRGSGPVANDPSSLVAAAAGLPVTSTAGPNSAASLSSSANASKPRTKATATITRKPKAKTATGPAKTSKAAAVKVGAGGPGIGRIQYGKTYSGQATFYGATGAGNCSFEASSDLMVGAMNQQDYENSQACGAHLSVTGVNGTVTIRIVDRCPECPPGAIDLSRPAFEKIAPISAGRVPITWRLLSPAGLGPVSYRYKSGSSPYWCGIQVRNHRNPVRSLQVKVGSSWKALSRQEYNYFLAADGSGCGGTIRITDIYGNQITTSGLRIAPDQTQPGQSQFPPPS